MSRITKSVVESDKFLYLFPYRYHFIEAEHPTPGERPQWRTESRYPLHDRLILQGEKLYGVSFGATTKYLMIDLDRSGLYHPANDPDALPRLLSALEQLGLTKFVTVKSSYSGGLHLYFPFEEARSSFWLAAAVRGLLCAAGLPPADGHLELFPNPKSYNANFRAHRLPLQQGSYILNRSFEPVWGGREEFVRQWELAAQGNDPASDDKLKLIAQEHDRQPRHLGGSQAKFYADLQAEILPGWTGSGQTNRILGRIAIREYVFGNLKGDALATAIAQVARSLPGFEQWCRHKAELLKRAACWARSVENDPRYYPAGTKPAAAEVSDKPNGNDLKAQAAQEKIRQAVATLLEREALPTEATARREAIYELARVSYKTLYKYPELWHPDQYTPPRKEGDIEKPESLSESGRTHLNPNKVLCQESVRDGSQANPVHSLGFEDGGSGGFSTASSPADGAKLIAQIVQRIRVEVLRQRQNRPQYLQIEPIPDEKYFARFRSVDPPSHRTTEPPNQGERPP